MITQSIYSSQGWEISKEAFKPSHSDQNQTKEVFTFSRTETKALCPKPPIYVFWMSLFEAFGHISVVSAADFFQPAALSKVQLI